MAADCMTRVWALAIATAACIGLPSALIYAIVRIAAARRYGATFAMAVVLVLWVTVSAAYYPRVCADLVPWLRILHLARGRAGGDPELLVPQRSPSVTVDAFPRPRPPPAPAARGGARAVRADDVSAAPSPYPLEQQHLPLAQRYGDGERRVVMRPVFPWEQPAVIVVPPRLPPRYPLYEYEQQRDVPSAPSHGGDRASTSGTTMAALPREPPAARGKACDDGEPFRYCAICMTNVDEEAAAKWLPLCLHVFHRHCIDQWLQGHSTTCPICRCNAFLTDSCMSLYGR